MPSVSPGNDAPSTFHQILPGAPVAGLQSTATLTFRWKRYLFYISKRQLNILRSQHELVQAIKSEGDLVAVTAEPGDSGRIALATGSTICLLKPVTSKWNRVTWAKELLLQCDKQGELLQTLSWSSEGELLAGGSAYLSLFSTTAASQVSSPADEHAQVPLQRRTPLWTKAIAAPLQFARFCPSANLIATSAFRDRLVKIWRRLSFEEAIFDFAYLPHDGIVTHIEWRPNEPDKLETGQEIGDRRSIVSNHGSDEQCEVLYTLATDAQLRIWRTGSHHDLDMLSLYTIIDLVSAIPHSPVLRTRAGSPTQKPARYAFILPSFAYETATRNALKKQSQAKLRHSLEHIREVSSREPDIVVAVDAQGRMSAWGVSSVGHKRRPESATGDVASSPFHIAHSDDMGLQFDSSEPAPATFETWVDGDSIHVLMHCFEHGVKWWQSNVEDFSSSAAISDDRGKVLATLEGADDAVLGLSVSGDLRSLFVSSSSGTLTQWVDNVENKASLHRQVHVGSHVIAADTVQRGKSLLVLTQDALILVRDLRDGLYTVQHPLQDCQSLFMTRIEDNTVAGDETYLVYSNDGQFCVIGVNPTRADWQSREAILEVSNTASRLPFLDSSIKRSIIVSHAKALVHPRKAGWVRLVAISSDGALMRRDISVSAQIKPADHEIEERTFIFPIDFVASALDSTPNHAALLSSNGRTLLIVDVKDGYVEHRKELGSHAISLSFTRPACEEIVATQQTLLAIATETTVLVWARSSNSAVLQQQWHVIKSVSNMGTDLCINNINWLPQNHIVIGAGTSVFITDNVVAAHHSTRATQQVLDLTEHKMLSMSELAQLLNGPTVCWSVLLLRELVACGYFNAVVTVLQRLSQKLRFYTTGDQLDTMLGLDVGTVLERKLDPNDDLSDLSTQLDEVRLPFTSPHEQDKLKLVLRAAMYVQRHLQSLDTSAVKYLFDWRYRVLEGERMSQSGAQLSNGDTQSSDNKVAPVMQWREVVFAYHSQTQQPLLEVLLQYYENKFDWRIVRSLGIALWLHNVKAAQSEGAALASLEQIFDALGQSAYRATYPPNPAESSLYLLALRKKTVLLSLWRVATGNREQKTTSNFLKRDFTKEENKVAARKNAYALMGKRRFEYAAAFFLLADDVANAISLLAGQCDDISLAIAVMRAFCGNDDSTAHAFIQDRVVMDAQRRGDRWMLHWAHHVSGQLDLSAQALIGDFAEAMTVDGTIPMRSSDQDDPATLTQYRDLRDASIRSTAARRNNVIQVALHDEYRAVLRSARLLRHQGFWLLALHLVSGWRFITPGKLESKPFRDITGASTLTNDESSLLDGYGTTLKPPQVTADHDQTSAATTDAEPSGLDAAKARAAKAAEILANMRARNAGGASTSERAGDAKTEKEAPFKEPSASSLLDNFGF